MHVNPKNYPLIVAVFCTAVVFILALVLILFQYGILGEKPVDLSEGPIDDPAAVFWEIPDSSDDLPMLSGAGSEEKVAVSTTTENSSSTEETLPVKEVLFEYVRVVDGCEEHYEGECLNVRSGPGTDYPVVNKLRNDIILKIDGKVEGEDQSWFRIVFDEWLRYPERVKGEWYVAADFVEVLLDEGARTTWEHGNASTTKKIIVDRSDQMLYAYDGEEVFMETPISTGLELSPTPRGTFSVFKKTPSRYMQGPIPSIPGSDYYDLPGVPWNLYFTEQGAVIHGAYWHNSFGSQYSHGCVNVPPDEAKKLYNWASLGTQIVVRD